MHIQYLTELLGIKGFSVVTVEREQVGKRSVVILTLGREGPGCVCDTCGQTVETGVPYREREVLHLPFWEHLTVLRVMQSGGPHHPGHR